MTTKDTKNTDTVSAPDGKAGQSPFFRALAKDGLGRRFTKASRNPNRRIPYKGNTLLIDARHNAVWTEQFLSDELNIDMIASRLVDKSTRESVLDFLKTPGNYLKAIMGMYKQPFVKFGDLDNSAPAVVSAIAGAGLRDSAGYVVSDMYLHVLAPTNTIEKTDPWYTSEISLGAFPDYTAILTEIIKHELSTALVGIPATVAGNVSGKISREILAERVQRQFEEVIIKLQGIGEYAVALQDVLLLIRACALPDVFMPRVLDETKGVNKFDRDWVEDPSIKKLAANVTLLNIALQNCEHTVIRTMPHRMDTWISRVTAFLTGGGRYREVTMADFRSKFSKQTVNDIFGVPHYCVLSQNVAPPAAAQVVDFLAGDKSSKTVVKMYEAADASAEMVSLFGDLPKFIASEHVVELTVAQLFQDSTLSEATDKGVVHFAMTDYSLGHHKSALKSDYDHSAVELALAIGSFEGCFLVETSEGSGKFEFFFTMISPKNAYDPVSGKRDLDSLYLSDPAEALMLADDWVGSYTEATHVQTIANKAMRMPYVNLDPIVFIDMTAEIKAVIGYKGSIGGTREIETNLMRLMGRENYSTYQAIAPLMVNAQGANYYSVLQAIDFASNTSENEMVRQASSATLITEITALANGMSTGVMGSFASSLRMQIAVQAPFERRQAVLATLESKLYQNQINIVLCALLTRRLGAFGKPVGKEDVLLKILASSAFFLKFEMPIS